MSQRNNVVAHDNNTPSRRLCPVQENVRVRYVAYPQHKGIWTQDLGRTAQEFVLDQVDHCHQSCRHEDKTVTHLFQNMFQIKCVKILWIVSGF